MNIYQITMIVQQTREHLGVFSAKLQNLLEEQSELPLFTMPDLPPDHPAIQIEHRRKDLHLSCTVTNSSLKEAEKRLQALCQDLHSKLNSDLFCRDLDVAGFVHPNPMQMTLDLVLQGPDKLYAVFHTGAVFTLCGNETLNQLEDPFSPLFQAGGLPKLTAAETRKVLNSRQLSPIWTRKGKRFTPNQGENWLSRHA